MATRSGEIYHIKFLQYQRILTLERKGLGSSLANYLIFSILISNIVI